MSFRCTFSQARTDRPLPAGREHPGVLGREGRAFGMDSLCDFRPSRAGRPDGHLATGHAGGFRRGTSLAAGIPLRGPPLGCPRRSRSVGVSSWCLARLPPAPGRDSGDPHGLAIVVPSAAALSGIGPASRAGAREPRTQVRSRPGRTADKEKGSETCSDPPSQNAITDQRRQYIRGRDDRTGGIWITRPEACRPTSCRIDCLWSARS